jgi:hypothetical protein
MPATAKPMATAEMACSDKRRLRVESQSATVAAPMPMPNEMATHSGS